MVQAVKFFFNHGRSSLLFSFFFSTSAIARLLEIRVSQAFNDGISFSAPFCQNGVSLQERRAQCRISLALLDISITAKPR
jgi:hypothetical protein